MPVAKSDIEDAVYNSLSIMTITGFDAPPGTLPDAIDPPGSANHLVGDLYGMNNGDMEPSNFGIIWTDYDAPGWTFDVLIATDEVENLRSCAEEAGYSIDKVEEVGEPMVFGDGSGTCTILKHPEGWIVAS
jgi:hypothetical protein